MTRREAKTHNGFKKTPLPGGEEDPLWSQEDLLTPGETVLAGRFLEPTHSCRLHLRLMWTDPPSSDGGNYMNLQGDRAGKMVRRDEMCGYGGWTGVEGFRKVDYSVMAAWCVDCLGRGS